MSIRNISNINIKEIILVGKQETAKFHYLFVLSNFFHHVDFALCMCV